ncbi:hypothetical protein PTKU15_90910 [Paraburkholderia terrae]|nr:hypothetical protein PTKU15_90910 [Paraburkholderia terrae]
MLLLHREKVAIPVINVMYSFAPDDEKEKEGACQLISQVSRPACHWLAAW